jgi:hypothetical protein
MKEDWQPNQRKGYPDALRDQMGDMAAENISSSIKMDVRAKLEGLFAP